MYVHTVKFLETLLCSVKCQVQYMIGVHYNIMWFLFFCDLCQKYYHGESIAINVLVDNNTSKSVKKIKISGELT